MAPYKNETHICQSKKKKKNQKTGKLGSVEGLLEPPIPGETGNQIIPLRESGIRLPSTRIIPLRESGIYYKTEPGASGQEG